MDDTSSVLDTMSHSDLIWTVIVDWDRICRSRRVDFGIQTLKYWAFDSGVFDQNSPMRLDRYCLQACTYLGQDPIVTRTKKSNSVELNTVQGWAVSRYLSSSLPFCVRFNVSVTRHAATLDTRLVSNSYPSGSHTHLSTNHF